ncbi:MAG: PKD domain-containing protein [Bacteroidales bacterium]|nr:PKD domain-containing protein [Bacteroidales bacterium]
MKKFYFLLFISVIFFSSCAKKGNVDVKDIGFWVNNCTPSYEVQFYLDVAYQPKEITYNWDFGDGQTSTEKEPVHLYTTPGKYTVVLTIVNYKTTVDKSLIVDVSQNPMPIQADFSYEALGGKYYAPCEMSFFNNSQYASNFFWDFGDGYGSIETEPVHIFQEAGTYNIKLNAICNGDTVTSVIQKTILPPPSTIYVDVVSVWLPSEFLGGLYELEYASGGFNETPIDLADIEENSFPMTWFIGDDLFFFSGNYNSEQLYFQVNDKYDYDKTIYSFSSRFEDIQADNYPDTLYWDAGNGFAAEVLLSYGE